MKKITNITGSRTEKTRPWSDDELMIVDGLKVVYTVDEDGEVIVRLHGRKKCSVVNLKKKGRKVVMPRLFRREPQQCTERK